MLFFSIVTERPKLGHLRENLVGFSDSAKLLDVHDALIQAADVVQARYPYLKFLIETCDTVDAEACSAVRDAFEVYEGSGVFCIPFRERSRLSEGHHFMTDFETYCRVFDFLRNPDESGGLDDLWQYLHDEVGFLTFRLVLS